MICASPSSPAREDAAAVRRASRTAHAACEDTDAPTLAAIVERVLAEADAEERTSLAANGTLADPVEDFLAGAVAFLVARPDRDDLLERLRVRLSHGASGLPDVPPPDPGAERPSE
ncbi:hypothetical protein QNA08_00950 [Chelatococcus sp. SYSU_G07232]|uniref:Uncharacterized protein n=1 Tax=Chelatococcus albus TaxID=3047466 RepID=A0ABT7ABS0_9HYPH|nr:hypothetical protein [Chelatococcus sp. SYSU_G07232]MDJ1156812.1 hypothetical protein [Chelatococcus sp. SYSU_G07232]